MLGSLAMDSTGLAEHLRACTPANAGWLKVHCAAEVAHGFFAARIVTTGLLLVLLTATAFAFL